jgi:hypothetical protein
MSAPTASTPSPIATIAIDGSRVLVWVRVAHDGIEYVGRLCFRAEADGSEVADRAALPGRTADEVLQRACELSLAELEQRYRRAAGEKRRYRALRRATDDVLDEIRRLNEIAIAMKVGLADGDVAAQEIVAAEARLHRLVESLRAAAGTEGD